MEHRCNSLCNSPDDRFTVCVCSPIFNRSFAPPLCAFWRSDFFWVAVDLCFSAACCDSFIQAVNVSGCQNSSADSELVNRTNVLQQTHSPQAEGRNENEISVQQQQQQQHFLFGTVQDNRGDHVTHRSSGDRGARTAPYAHPKPKIQRRQSARDSASKPVEHRR
ncbi:uncharacterized protein LOC6035239 [Culex quinquefasciatus]|uniref:uncharacterized protein LOC6035239 n=1 Tax=Culex quinquefasciatus TaxID=7176 RepID=UPI0018E356BD|nr:uncharacterized protein LOC6035239 [Culex quinquefasciatus]